MKVLFEKKYDPLDFEDKIYEKWIESNCFKASNKKTDKKTYAIAMPPPNVTGKLHMGHSLDNTLQDILIRFKRMMGFDVLWVPGVDHSAIATEVKLVEQLREEGLTKEEIGREEFLKRAFAWKEKYEDNILNQLKKLGVSCDFSRKRFTMDEQFSEAVFVFFKRLYDDGLIYRGKRIINWCFGCGTSLSDAEVEHKEKDGNFYYIKYKLADEDGYLEIATTRPETIFADVAVAVNTDDERYKKYAGKSVLVPIINKKIPIIYDSYVEKDFGTGALKITPGHDPNDFEIGKRHNLEIIDLFDDKGKLNSFAGPFEGMDRKKARKEVAKKLEELGVLVKIEPLKHGVGHCYRCGEVVEPKLSMQWFVKMDVFKKPALEVVQNGDINFIPKRFEKIYFNWVENVRDWCISRQLWWGHFIPAYHCLDCGHINISRKMPSCCEKCRGSNLEQDGDTLDTWFSAALWPFSIFGWPDEKSPDYLKFYPTDTLVTGYDIIFFWVARMIFAGLYNTKKAPFKNVLIHGLVRDEQGRKMSKSLGNGVDPIDVIKLYGADALRFTLASGVNAGNDMRYSEKKVVASRNFANKLWNASRFIFMQLNELDIKLNFNKISFSDEDLFIEDRWILYKLNVLIKELTKNIEDYEISVACSKLYEFIWSVFCDWYIELFKIKKACGFYSKDSKEEEKNRKSAFSLIVYVLDSILKLLHPFMPFITQKIYFELYGEDKIISTQSWPKEIENLDIEKKAKEFEKVIEVVGALRNFRAAENIAKKVKITVYIKTNYFDIFKECEQFLVHLAGCQEVNFIEDKEIENSRKIVTDSAIIYVYLGDLVDEEKEKEKLLKEKEFLEKEISIFEKKLSNDNFLNKAPQDVVLKEKEKLSSKQEKLSKILSSLKNF